MTIGERIKACREYNNMTQSELAQRIGTTKQTIYKYEMGIVTNIPTDRIERIANLFDVTPSYLMGWDNTAEPPEPIAVRIPVLGSIPAGVPLEAIEDVIDWEDIPAEWARGGQEFFALRVRGDSMYPKFVEDDTIILRKACDCENGDICAVYVNGYDATLKKVLKKRDCIVLQPLNAAYEPMVFDYNDEFNTIRIAGIVVEIRRKV